MSIAAQEYRIWALTMNLTSEYDNLIDMQSNIEFEYLLNGHEVCVVRDHVDLGYPYMLRFALVSGLDCI